MNLLPDSLVDKLHEARIAKLVIPGQSKVYGVDPGRRDNRHPFEMGCEEESQIELLLIYIIGCKDKNERLLSWPWGLLDNLIGLFCDLVRDVLPMLRIEHRGLFAHYRGRLGSQLVAKFNVVRE